MSDSTPNSERLNEIISEYLHALDSGTPLDRKELLRAHPALADELQAFFDQHDQLHAPGHSSEEATLAPQPPPREEPTLAPRDDEATIPPAAMNEGAVKVGGRIRYFGDYELIEEIARGGMGVVYKARQVSLNRIVALKMILAGQLAGEEDVKRFQAEAEAAANLDHPGIVPIYEIGEHDGQHYFSMGFVEGQSLADKIKDGPLPPREAAEYVLKVAEAVEFAHERGVIHRDLKPGNVLLDQIDEPKVTDFGLAKRIEGDSDLTATGQILGTPSYMPPEQASGKVKEITGTADVYSLGAILFALVTGRPPFQADNSIDTLLQVLDREPIAPRMLNATVPLDLETICLKCLEKDQQGRYASARDLAAELTRFLRGEPIEARPISSTAKAWRWCKRNPVVASLVTAVSICLVAGTVISTYFALTARHNERLADNRYELAREEAKRADNNAIRAKENSDRADENASQAQAERRVAEKERDRALFEQYRALISLAERDWLAGNAGDAILSLNRCPWNYRNWEHDYLYTEFHRRRRVLRGHTYPVLNVAFVNDGKRIVSAGGDNTIRVWNSQTGDMIRMFNGNMTQRIYVTSNGSRIFGNNGYSSGITFWSTDTGKSEGQLAVAEGSLSFDEWSVSPNGRWIATPADKTHRGLVRIWDTDTGALRTLMGSSDITALNVVFSSDGARMAAGNALTTGVWDVATGRQIATIEQSDTEKAPSGTRAIGDMCFSPDGSAILLAKFNSLALYSAETGEVMWETSSRRATSPGLAFSPDGLTIYAALNSEVLLYNAANGRESGVLRGPADVVRCLSLSADGRRIAAGSLDKAIHIWDLPPHGRSVALEDYEGGGVSVLANATDVVFAGAPNDEKVVTIWDGKGRKILSLGNYSKVLALSRDGRRVAALTGSDNLVVVDIRTKSETSLMEKTKVRKALFHANDELLTVCTGRLIVTWNLRTHSEVLRSESSRSLLLSPDERHVAAYVNGANGGQLDLYDLRKGETIRKFEGHSARWGLSMVAFSPDGTKIVSGSADKTAVIWDVETGAKLKVLRRPNELFTYVDYSLDGKRILTSHRNRNSARLWDTRTGETVLKLDLGPGYDKAVFSPDGNQIYAVSFSGPPKCFEATSRQELSLVSSNELMSIRYDPESEQIIGALIDGKVNVWSSDTGRPAPLLSRTLDADKQPREMLTSMDYHTAGKRLLAAMGRSVHVWTLDGDLLREFDSGTRLVTAASFDPTGNFVASSAAGGTFVVWEIATKKVVAKFEGHIGAIIAISWSPDGATIATASMDGTARIWDAATGKQKAMLAEQAPSRSRYSRSTDVLDIQLHPNGKHAVASYMSGCGVVWDIEDGQKVVSFNQNSNLALRALALSPDGEFIAGGDASGRLGIWSLANGQLVNILPAHAGIVRDVLWLSDGRILTASADEQVKLWNVPVSQVAGSPRIAQSVMTEVPSVDTTGAFTSTQDTSVAAPASEDIKELVDEINRATAEQLVNSGRSRDRSKKYDEAAGFLRRATKIRPDWAQPHLVLGQVLLNQKRPQEAIVELRKALELDSELADAHATLGKAYLELQDVEQAIKAYRDTIQISPGHKGAVYQLCLLLPEQGEYRELLDVLDGGVEAMRDDAWMLNLSAWQLLTIDDPALRDPELALERARRGSEKDPKNLAVWNTLGLALYRVGHYREAIDALSKSVDLHNGSLAEDQFFLAMAHFQLNEIEQARECFRQGRELMKKKSSPDDLGKAFETEARELLGKNVD